MSITIKVMFISITIKVMFSLFLITIHLIQVYCISRFESSTGFGCILAHSMGLGKTLQIVCFSDIFLRHTPARTILCIMPINTLQNWLAEYNMWLPTEEAAGNLYSKITFTRSLHDLNLRQRRLLINTKEVCIILSPDLARFL